MGGTPPDAKRRPAPERAAPDHYWAPLRAPDHAASPGAPLRPAGHRALRLVRSLRHNTYETQQPFSYPFFFNLPPRGGPAGPRPCAVSPATPISPAMRRSQAHHGERRKEETISGFC